jgi:hypothetical protein
MITILGNACGRAVSRKRTCGHFALASSESGGAASALLHSVVMGGEIVGALPRCQPCPRAVAAFFKKGAASHVNNVSLGTRGRHRSNVWTYPGASSLGSDARQGLQEHPTVKPTAMLQDALVDLSHRDDIILEPFGGPGRR